MDNGFDYPNDLCVQNALWRRLDAIEILQIRLQIRIANKKSVSMEEKRLAKREVLSLLRKVGTDGASRTYLVNYSSYVGPCNQSYN